MAVMPSEALSDTPAQLCADCLFREGYAALGRVLTDEVVANLNKEFDRRYAHLILPGADFGKSLETGNRRHMLTVELSGAFGDSSVYANPFILDVLNLVFDGQYVLESFGAVLSLPGAKTQHTHRDGNLLHGLPLDSMLPPFAVTVGIPLVAMNEEQGTTELFPASHRWKDSSTPVRPEIPAGSAILWDFRTLHRGTENRSKRYRPLLYMTYGKPWWRDSDNFEPAWSDAGPPAPQKKVLAAQDFFKALPKENRFLFRNFESLG